MNNQSIPKEISNAAARMLEPFAPGLTGDTLAEAITYQPEAEAEGLLTRFETAGRLRISTVTVDRMLRAGQLPKRRIRGSVRIPASAVESIVAGKGGCNE